MLRRLRLWFLPFAMGSGVAALAAWARIPVPLQGLLFVAVSVAALFALRPLARILALSSPAVTVGAHRWVGRQARVDTAIPAHGEGWVALGRERWRAQSGMGVPIPRGSTVLITAAATKAIFQAIHDGRPTDDVLAVKYLECLAAVADGRATKIFIPTEATAALGALGGMAELLKTGAGKTAEARPNGSGARRPAAK